MIVVVLLLSDGLNVNSCVLSLSSSTLDDGLPVNVNLILLLVSMALAAATADDHPKPRDAPVTIT